MAPTETKPKEVVVDPEGGGGGGGGEGQPLLLKTPTTTDPSIPQKPSSTTTIGQDAWDTILLGVPIFIAMVSFVGMKTTDTALLGHVSRDALAGAALSDLWTMCTGVLIQGRVLGVLIGGAMGAGNPKLAGIYLQVSYVVLSGVSVLVFVSWNITAPLWKAFGSREDISDMAGYYARVLSWSIPGQLIVGQLSQFFSAQRIMHPEVNASVVALIGNLVLGLYFVLGIPRGIAPQGFLGFGFDACPIVTTTLVYVQLAVFVIIYCWWQRLHEPCWDGWKWSEITYPRIKTFSELYFPAALSMASDFWRVAVIGAVAAKLGEEEVAVFNTSYRVMWIVMILAISMSGASGINMAQRLGKLDHVGAKQAGYVGVVMAGGVSLLISVAVLCNMRLFGQIFTNDEVFLALFEDTKWSFTTTLFLMNFSVVLERVPYSMGRTKEVFWMGFIASWGAQVPGVILLTTYWRNDLIGLYTGMGFGYLACVVLYGYIVLTSDWRKQAILARERSESSD